jgi:hypothetical protein
MDIFHSDPNGTVKTLSKLLLKHKSSYEFPVECRMTAKLAVNEMASSKFGHDMEKNNFLRQSTLLLEDIYWDEIVKNVSQVPKKSNQVLISDTKTEDIIEGSEFGLFYKKYMDKYKVSHQELKKALARGKLESKIFVDGLYIKDLPLHDSKTRPSLNRVGLSRSEIFLFLLIAIVVISTVIFTQIDGTNDSEIAEATKEKTSFEDQPVDSTYSVYVGQAGIYQSPFVMYLKNINGRYQGQYIYTRHQKWINLSGEENNEGYVELNESYQTKPTGKIVFKPNGLELNGEGFWGDDNEGENFNAKLVDKVNEIRQHPKDGKYIRNHKIWIVDGNNSKEFDDSDELAIQHFSDKGFTFYLYEVTDNGHSGRLAGEATYDEDKAYFVTNNGCELTFSFDGIRKTAEYQAKALQEDSWACYDEFGGARNSLTHNKLVKVE